MLKELKILLQKYFGISSPKPTVTKKPTPAKAVTTRQKMNSLVSEIGKDILGVNVRIELGRCPYCELITQMMSTRIGYFRCSNCHEITRQYVNGHISYLPINEPTALGNEPQA